MRLTLLGAMMRTSATELASRWGSTMSIEEKTKLVRRYSEDVADQGKLDLIDDFLAPDPPYYGPDCLENFKRKRAESRAALSEVSFDIEDMIAEEDKVVVRGT